MHCVDSGETGVMQAMSICFSIVQAMTKIRSEVQEEDEEQTKGTMEIMHVDLASLQSTKHFAEAFKARRLPLHILINNAGIALARKGFTEDSYETHFQVHTHTHTYIYMPS